MYLGVTPFPISTRNSAIGVAHLASKTAVRQMFVSTDPAMQRLAREANEILARGEGDVKGEPFEVLRMPDFEDMYGPGGDDELVPMGPVSPDKASIILHSSGEVAPCMGARPWGAHAGCGHGTHTNTMQVRPRFPNRSNS